MRSLLHAPRTRKRRIAAATLGALALIASLLVATPAQALNDTGTGGVFVPSTGRILDTAKGTGGYSTPMEAGTYRTIKVAGLAGLPDDGSVGAVSLNATVGASSGYGTLFGRPDADSGRTTMLIYNGVSGEYTSNTATLAVGSDGTIQVMTETNARLILDVQGYYTAHTDGTAAGGFVPVAKRIVDTRSGTGAVKAAIAPGKSIDVQVTGANGVPAGASAAVVNLIAVNGTDADGYLTPYATGATKPANSLHYAPSENTSIQAQVPLSSSGKMTIANSSTTANLIVDLQGYFTAAGKSGAVFTPSYGRAYDSRATGNTALGEQETRSIQIAGTAGVPVMGSGVTAVVLTLIVAHGGGDGYADVYADGKTDPGTTAINFNTGEIQTNTITVPLGANGKISLRNAAKATNYVVDVQGWYTNPQASTISCPAPYAANSYGDAFPDGDITCTVTSPPAASSSDATSVLVDGVSQTVYQDGTSATSTDVTVPGIAGEHTIEATSAADQGNVDNVYNFTIGDWTQGGITVSPSDQETTPLDPTFSTGSGADSSLPSDAAVVYSVWNTADTTQQPIATSPETNDDWQAPTGTFTDGQTYWVAPTITGATGWDGSEATLSLPATSFTVSSTTAEPDQTVDSTDSSGPAPVHVLDSGAYDYNVTTQKVISKKHVSSSYTLAAKKGVIGACHAYNTKTPCSVSANRTVTSTVNTSAGYSKGGVSASIGFSDGVSTTVTVGCGSREISAGQTLYGLAVGDYWTYKIQTTTQDRFHYHPASVRTSSTLWAFNPHKSAISCAVYKGFPFGSGS